MTLICGKIIHEDYLISDINADKHFSLLDNYFFPGNQTYKIDRNDVNRAIEITDYCLKQFKDCSLANQEWLISFAGKLPYLEKSNDSKRLITLFGKSPLINQVTTDISLYLTPARKNHTVSEKNLDIAIKISRFAVAYYENMPFEVQEDLFFIQKLLSIRQPELLASDENFKTLRKIFSENLKPPKQTTDSNQRALKVTEIENGDFCLTPVGLSKSQEVGLIKKQEVIRLNLNFINRFFSLFAKHYYSEFFFLTPLSPVLKEQFNQQFFELFPPIAKTLFLTEPRLLLRLEKLVIVHIINSATLFFHDFTYALNEDSNTSQTLKGRIKARLKIPDGTPFDLQEQTLKSVDKIVTLLVFKGASLSDQQKFFKLILTNSLTELIDKLINPNTFSFVIHRFLNGSLEKLPEAEVAPPSAFLASDKEFSKKLGSGLISLYTKLLHFGEIKGIANAITSILSAVLAGKKSQIGTYIQQLLERVTAAECIIDPIRALHLILFEADHPTLPAFLSKTEKQCALFSDQLYSELEEKYLPALIESIKSKSRAGSYALELTSTKEFCQNFTSRLKILLQDKELLRAFAFYLLDGVQKAAGDEVKKREHEKHQ